MDPRKRPPRAPLAVIEAITLAVLLAIAFAVLLPRCTREKPSDNDTVAVPPV